MPRWKRTRSTEAKVSEQVSHTHEDALQEEDNVERFNIPLGEKTIECQRYGERNAPSLIFTHGAGGGINSAVMTDFARGFAVVRPIVSFRGNMNLQFRIKAFHTVTQHEQTSVALGGRSMGARAAVLTALTSDKRPQALILVSYPLTAGKKGEKREPERREQILLDLTQDTDVLFVIGDRDQQCELNQLAELREQMEARSWLVKVQGADHGMDLRHKSGVHEARSKTGSIAAEWIRSRNEGKREGSVAWNKETSEVEWTDWL